MTSEIYQQICVYLRKLITATSWQGHVYAVGGCCRDLLLGDPIKDIDLAVDLPDGGVKFARWLEKHHQLKGRAVLFKRFGTARVSLRRFPDIELEIVQTRRRKYTAENAANPAMAFGSLEEDAFRRDLTINSLFYDISNDKLLDPTGMALADIADRRLRTPLDPQLTFEDDPLRILRCIRFALRYGHDIDPATTGPMKDNADGLDSISRERLHNEFDKILMTSRPTDGLRLLDSIGALPKIVPEIYVMANEIDNDGQSMLQHTLLTLDYMVKANPQATLEMRWSALLHDIGKPSTRVVLDSGMSEYPNHETVGVKAARQILRRLRYERSVVEQVMFLIGNHSIGYNRGQRGERIKERQLRRLQLECGTLERFNNLMELIDADNRTLLAPLNLPQQVQAIKERTLTMVKRGDALFNYQLPLSNDEIIKGLHCHTSSDIEKAKARLLKAACSNPQRSKQDFMRELGIDQSSLATSSKTSAKRRHHRRRSSTSSSGQHRKRH